MCLSWVINLRKLAAVLSYHKKNAGGGNLGEPFIQSACIRHRILYTYSLFADAKIKFRLTTNCMPGRTSFLEVLHHAPFLLSLLAFFVAFLKMCVYIYIPIYIYFPALILSMTVVSVFFSLSLCKSCHPLEPDPVHTLHSNPILHAGRTPKVPLPSNFLD